MSRISFTTAARDDLLDIWSYAAINASENVADRIIDRLYDAAIRLTAYPEMGRPRPDIAGDARSVTVARWLVLYRIIYPDIQIVRVIDGARDLKNVDWNPNS